MKSLNKLSHYLVILLFLCTFTACGNQQQNVTEEPVTSPEPQAENVMPDIPKQPETLPVMYQKPAYMVDSEDDEDLFAGDEDAVLKVGATIRSTRGPQPSWDILDLAIEQARQFQGLTVLFIDEVHRFNKAQQDAFLPHIEDGTILFVGATTLLTETYSSSEKAKAQALNDFIVFGTVTITSFSSGAIQHALGWQTINIAVIPFLIIVGLSNLWLRGRPRVDSP